MKKANYPNNIYIKNHKEVEAMGGDIGATLDKYDRKHGIPYNERAHAEYTHWCSVRTGVDLLSVDEKKLLGIQ